MLGEELTQPLMRFFPVKAVWQLAYEGNDAKFKRLFLPLFHPISEIIKREGMQHVRDRPAGESRPS